MKRTLILVIALFIGLGTKTGATDMPTEKQTAEIIRPGHGIERTMTLLATSRPDRRNTVRLLFYGQSGVESPWWPLVVNDLKRRYPTVNFIIENRALGGFASQLLVKTSEADLYPFQPDLMIFNVSGADDTYTDIIRRTTERTVADILILNEYVRTDAGMSEETDPARIVRGAAQWGEYMSFVLMPSLALKYGTGLVPVRQHWKQYLKEKKIAVIDLLGPDKSHLNEAGCDVMAGFVNAHLVPPEAGFMDPYQCDRVQTLYVGREIAWKNGKLNLNFTGNRVDVLFDRAGGEEATLKLDGKKPSEHVEIYRYTRALTELGGKFPVILKIDRETLPLVEDWTLAAVRDPSKEGQYTFTVRGSLTGEDGGGRTDEKFVSRSGRIVIDPGDWSYPFVFGMLKVHIGEHTAYAAAGPAKALPESFTVRWHVEPLSRDQISAPKNVEAGCECVTTAVQGLRNGEHQLEIRGDSGSRISALRIYRPRLAASE